jgi:glycosyltransferase involved in cell wall biosynthesis
MRVLHALNSFPPISRAGSENYVEALALEQRRRHEVSVLYRVADLDRPEYEGRSDVWRGLPVHTVNRTFRDLADFRETLASEPLANAVRARLEDWRPDIVHFHHISCLSTISIEAARSLGIPVVFTLLNYWLSCPRGQRMRRDQSLCTKPSDAECVNCMAAQLRIRRGHPRTVELWQRTTRFRGARFARRLDRRLATRPFRNETAAIEQIRERTAHVQQVARDVSRFISPSRWLRDEFVAQGFPADRIRVLDNGYDHTIWQDQPPPAPRTADTPLRLVYLGTWIPTKGVHVLVEAVRDLDPTTVSLDIHGLAVPYEGDEDYESQLRELAEGRSQIRFHERYSPEDVPRLLAEADAVVVPSTWYENSPSTLHEASLAGVPVIVSDHGGLREFVRHGHNGLTFRPGNVASLRSVIQSLARHPECLDQLRANIPQVMRMDDHLGALDAIYREALE